MIMKSNDKFFASLSMYTVSIVFIAILSFLLIIFKVNITFVISFATFTISLLIIPIIIEDSNLSISKKIIYVVFISSIGGVILYFINSNNKRLLGFLPVLIIEIIVSVTKNKLQKKT